MTIDLSEELIPLVQVPSLPFIPRRRGGKKLNAATVFRWASPKRKGARLETLRCGGTLCTTKGAILAFFRELTPENNAVEVAPHRTPTQRERAAERAERELAAIGI